MRLLGWSAAEAAAFLTTMRNIVDLNSRAPPSRGRVATVRPIDFLESVEGKVHVSHPAASKVALGFVPLRRKAIEAGFVAAFPVGKASKPPLLYRSDRQSSSSEAESMLLPQQFQLTEAEASDTGASFYHVPHPPEGFDKGTWHFLETPVSTPGGSSNHGETSDLRRRKLRLLVQDLTALQRKLEGHVDAAGGFEPGVTLKDASGEVGAVVVGSGLTLLAAPSAASGSVPEPLHPPGYVSGSVPEPMHPPGYADGSKKRPAEPSKDEQPHLKTAKDETKEELSLGHCSPRRMRPKQGSRSLDRRSLSQGRVAFSWAGGRLRLRSL